MIEKFLCNITIRFTENLHFQISFHFLIKREKEINGNYLKIGIITIHFFCCDNFCVIYRWKLSNDFYLNFDEKKDQIVYSFLFSLFVYLLCENDYHYLKNIVGMKKVNKNEINSFLNIFIFGENDIK